MVFPVESLCVVNGYIVPQEPAHHHNVLIGLFNAVEDIESGIHEIKPKGLAIKIASGFVKMMKKPYQWLALPMVYGFHQKLSKP